MNSIGSYSSGATVTSLLNISKAFSQLGQASLLLSTGSRLNHGFDDPSGLLAVESMRSELVAVNQASRNTVYARNDLHVADAAIGEASGLMRTIRENVLSVAGGGLSDSEVAAKQIEVDAAIHAINNLGKTTSLGGRKLLAGETLSFSFSPDPGQMSSLTMPNVQAEALGGSSGTLSELATGGSASMTSGELERSMNIISDVESQLVNSRAKIGAFEKYTINSSQAILGNMQINLSSAISETADTDMALSLSMLVRAKVLAQSSILAAKVSQESRGMILGLLGNF